MTAPTEMLRRRLAGEGIIVAPGAADGLSAKLVARAGFEAVYCTGGGISRGMGLPDIGNVTMTEMVARVANIAEVCPLPLIADMDAGFGNVTTVMRAIRALERAGAAAVHIEDKEVPRRRRDPAGNLIAPDEMVGRIKAALRARTDPDFVLVARTDALPLEGVEAAIERANRYADAGADVIYVEHMVTRAQMEAVAVRVAAPKLVSLNKGTGEILSAHELAAMGYRILTLPADAQLAAIHAMEALLAHLKAHGSTSAFEAMIPFRRRDELVGLAEARALEDELLP
jgi:2-methylisocitrate lyase-like PEP mutase family enzyme